MNYPSKLFFKITTLNENELEFDADIEVGKIIEGIFIGKDAYEDCDGNMIECAYYQTDEIYDYPLMVEEEYIDNNEEFFSHHSFGYLILSNKN